MRAMFFRAMKAFRRTARWLAVPALGLVSACGVSFDPASEVKTLRVLGVQKDEPYPVAGSDVHLKMLWHDGSQQSGRAVQVAWLPPCFNPPGGLYYACGPQLLRPPDSACTDSVPGDAGPVGTGSSHCVRIPPDIVPTEGVVGQPRSGVTFVFFAVCAGTLSPVEMDEEGALPLACLDAEGRELGPEDFVAGYTTLYTFPEGFANQNPVFGSSFRIDGQEIGGEVCTDQMEGACIPTAEAADPAPIDCGADPRPAACVPACEDDGDPDCPEIELKPSLNESMNAEPDEVAAAYFNRNVGEQMWVNYYVDKGGLNSEVRLLNDAMVGWNDDYGAKFFAPKDAVPVNVWAVAHDNRGGVGWARVRLQVYTPP